MKGERVGLFPSESDSSQEFLATRIFRFKRVKKASDEGKMGFNDKNSKAKTRNFGKLVRCNRTKKNIKGDSNTCECASVRAQDIQTKLSPQFPSCVKLLSRWNVAASKGFCLNLPKQFSEEHLPNLSENVVFVDENEKEFRIWYSVKKCRFYAGWKEFFVAHKLREGDALVFHLIEPCKLKVHIVRACRPTEVDQSIGQNRINEMMLNWQKMQGETTVKEEYIEYFEMDSPQEESTPILKCDRSHSESASDKATFSGSYVSFQDVKRFEDFKIYLNNQIIDSEIPTNTKKEYYDLCCSQKMFLHDHLLESLGSKLVAAMISETINIADAIKFASLASNLHHLECWDKTLKAFEDLGMTVGFLRARIDKLVKISREYKTTDESSTAKSAQIEEKKRALDLEVSTVDTLLLSIETIKQSITSLEAEANVLKGKNEGLGFEFKAVAGSPW